MRTFCEFEYGNHVIKVLGSDWNGMEQVLVDGEVVSEKRNLTSFRGEHPVPILGGEAVKVQFHIGMSQTTWRLLDGEEVLLAGEQPHDKSASESDQAQKESPGAHWIGLGGIFFKIFKSGSAVKVALAGGSLAGYSLLLSWQFALMLIAIIVVHEYGHVWAMKRFGIPTKGFYLIPFFGGVAVGDKARTNWQEVYISMMGPVFGLMMTLVCWLGFLVTDMPLLAVVASFSALINLFNLLPVYPLDGGHVLKAIVFSLGGWWSWALLFGFSAAGFALAVNAGLYFISFFLVLGAVDLVGSRNELTKNQTAPMDTYGMSVSMLWYVVTATLFIWIILDLAATGIAGTDIPALILRD